MLRPLFVLVLVSAVAPTIARADAPIPAVRLLSPSLDGSATRAWSCRGSTPQISLRARVENTHATLSSSAGKLTLMLNGSNAIVSAVVPPIPPKQTAGVVLIFTAPSCEGAYYRLDLTIPNGPLAVTAGGGQRYLQTRTGTTFLKERSRRPCIGRCAGNCLFSQAFVDSLAEAAKPETSPLAEFFASLVREGARIARIEGAQHKGMPLEIRAAIQNKSTTRSSVKFKLVKRPVNGPDETFPAVAEIAKATTYPFTVRSTTSSDPSVNRCYNFELERVKTIWELQYEQTHSIPTDCNGSLQHLDRYYWDGEIVTACEEVDELRIYDVGTTSPAPG